MNNSQKRKVLLFADWYYPGFKAGGPIQSCVNLVATLSDDFIFYVITSDRDLGELCTYQGISIQCWIPGPNNEQVLYIPTNKVNISFLQSVINELKPDVVYLNSMFSFRYAILPRLVLKFLKYNGKVIVAPRGMLHPGALGLKVKKKLVFLKTFKVLGLHKKLCFHATDQKEVVDIRKIFPVATVSVAENIPKINSTPIKEIIKNTGILKLLFLSRIHPTKNLYFILSLLQNKNVGQIALDIFGNIEDDLYYDKCLLLKNTLPPNVIVTFKGTLPSQQAFDTIVNYHALILPTLGENFGHVIFETLTCGRPVILSDQTPWRNLEEKNAGWDLPLNDKEEFSKVLDRLLFMEQDEFNDLCKGAKQLADQYIETIDFKDKYNELFSS